VCTIVSTKAIAATEVHLTNEPSDVGVGGQECNGIEYSRWGSFTSWFWREKNWLFGMAQRGGSVVSHLRWDKSVFFADGEQGEVDILIAFEKLEGARWAHYLQPIASRWLMILPNRPHRYPAAAKFTLAINE